MRHNKKINHLGRTKAHREAMLSNMAASLIKHKRIFTTTAKAKALRKYIEPLITKSKTSDKTSEEAMHSRRMVFALLQDKHAVAELFSKVAEKVGDRPGGYTRIIKTGARLGDNASMCFIELVDFDDNMMKDTKKAAGKTRRSRRKASGASEVTSAGTTASAGATDAKTSKSKASSKKEEKAVETAAAVVEEVSPVVAEVVEENASDEAKEAIVAEAEEVNTDSAVEEVNSASDETEDK
jgi:large subunit ribosomal protein L17